MKLNSAQHARSAASRLDDVIDRSALEQAREGLGGRDIEEPLIGLEVQKSTLEWCETVVFLHHAIPIRLKSRMFTGEFVLAQVVELPVNPRSSALR